MRLVTNEEYNNVNVIFKNEMTILAKHENKNSYYGQVAINQCFTCGLNNELQMFHMFTPNFLFIIEHDYIKALKENCDCFGTGNAKDIIHALHLQAQKRNYPWGEERYAEFLSNECFCLLICKKGEIFIDNFLRIDLFRHIKESKDHPGCYDFVGGIFHALKHFSVGEQCASIYPNQKVSLYDIDQLLWPIAKAFFQCEYRDGNRANTYEADIVYLNKKMTLEFFKEENIHVSFVNSVIPKSL